MSNNNHLLYIDILKGLAMLGVIFVHFTQYFDSGYPALNCVGYVGARCPQLFLIISAFLTWRSLSKRGGIAKDGLLTFYKGRIKKIAPLFYFALLLSTILPIARWQDWSLGCLITHLTFTNGLFPEWTNNWMKIEWYIADLALFYVLSPILYKYAHNLKSSILTFAGVFALNVLFTLVTNNMLANQIATDENIEMYFHTFCLINQLPVLMMGVVLYYLINHIDCKGAGFWRCFGVYAVVSISVLAAFVQFHLNKEVVTSSFIAGLLFSGLIIVMSKISSKINGGGISWYSRPISALVEIGKHSYGMYCLHYTIILCLKNVPLVRNFDGNLWAWIGLYLFVVAVSYYVGRIAEKIIVIK